MNRVNRIDSLTRAWEEQNDELAFYERYVIKLYIVIVLLSGLSILLLITR